MWASTKLFLKKKSSICFILRNEIEDSDVNIKFNFYSMIKELIGMHFLLIHTCLFFYNILDYSWPVGSN